MRILVLTDEWDAEVIGLRLEHRRPDLEPRVEYRNREDISTPADVGRVLRKGYDAIVLPLSLPNFSSVRIAEMVHLLSLPVRLVLKSATSAPKDVILPLFDHFDLCINLTLFEHLDELPRTRINDELKLTIAIEKLLGSAACLGPRHGHGEGGTLAEYIASGRSPRPDPPSTIHHYHGQVSVSQDHISVSHVTGLINVKSQLENVSQSVISTEVQRPSENLEDLLSELRTALAPAQESAPDDAGRVVQAAELVRAEATKSKPNGAFLNITAEGLKEAAKAVEGIAPSVIGIVARIVAAVSGGS